MGRGSIVAIVALLVAMVGAIVAFAAYFKRRNYSLCDDFDDMLDEDDSDLDYYSTPLGHDPDDMEDMEDMDDAPQEQQASQADKPQA